MLALRTTEQAVPVFDLPEWEQADRCRSEGGVHSFYTETSLSLPCQSEDPNSW